VPRFFCSNNFALSRQAFEKLGGFDESFSVGSEDRDFCARWAHAGGLRVYAPEVVVYHSHALGIAQFCHQHFRYGRGAFHFRRRSESGGRDRPRVEPLGFYLRLLEYPFRAAGGNLASRFQIALLLVLSQIANVWGFFAEAFQPHSGRVRTADTRLAE
jgi:GT2 family glycosyltransferase